MSSVIQSVKNTQLGLKSGITSGVQASVKNTQKKLKQDLGLTARLPRLADPLGAIRGAGGTVSALDFADGTDSEGLL